MNTDLLLKAYRLMTRIRLAEQAIADDFLKNKIFSFLHLSIGQEAVAVGLALACQTEDRFFGNHRSHAHYLAKEGDLYRMFAEIYGKADDCCKGKGGSMHMLDRSAHFMGSTPILGSVVPIATGSAFQQKASGSPYVTVCFFGDGASEEGVVYESVNLAAVMKLPVIFVIENNLYAVSSDERVRRSPKYSAGNVYSGLGAGFFNTNGNSFTATYLTAKTARKYVQDFQAPAVIEARVFREMAHSGPIKDENRTVDIPEVRHAEDPIKNIREHLTGRVYPEVRDRIYEEESIAVQSALLNAKAAAEPDPEELFTHIYA